MHVSKPSVLTAVLVCALVLTGCTGVDGGAPRIPDGTGDRAADAHHAVDPSFVHGTDGSDIDRLAATALRDVQAYWQQAFPDTFDTAWRELRGGYHSVDSSDRRAEPPPCSSEASDIEGNAYYCPSADALAWDRAALLPVLAERFGEGAVLLVLAHEVGHAVQRKSGLTPDVRKSAPERYPTIVIESMADCYAGAAVRWITDREDTHLRLSGKQLDSALGALISFRDPVGTSPSAESAHGDAFDRISAFQDGYQHGPELCADIDAHNRTFTQRQFLNLDDQASGGNLPMRELTSALRADAVGYFALLAANANRRWQPPDVRLGNDQEHCTSGNQGPVEYCDDVGTITLAHSGPLRKLHRKIGDYATGTLLASRYGMSLLDALGRPLRGRPAQRGALCLAGAYTARLLAREQGYALSPGDLDEAVQLLLAHDYASRDVTGSGIARGFDRVRMFRSGVLDGVSGCRLG